MTEPLGTVALAAEVIVPVVRLAADERRGCRRLRQPDTFGTDTGGAVGALTGNAASTMAMRLILPAE